MNEVKEGGSEVQERRVAKLNTDKVKRMRN